MQSKLKFVGLVVIVLFLFKTASAQQKVIDSIQQLLNKEKSDTQRINLILQLANIHRFSNTDTSNMLAASALLQSKKINFKKGEGFALHTLGIIQEFQGNYDSALHLYQQALQIFEKAKLKKGNASALLSIGGYYYYQSDFIKGADYMLQSLRIYEAIKDKEGQGAALNNLGSLYMDKKDYPNALQYFKKALAIKQLLNQGRNLASTMNNIGNVFYDTKKMDSALFWYQQSLANAQQFENKRGIASASSNIGNIYFDKEQYTAAVTQYEVALQIDRDRNDQEGIAVNLINIAHASVKLKQFDKSIPLLKEGLAMVREIDYKFHEQNALKYLAEAYAGKGDNTNAYNYLLQYINVHDSVYTQESNQRVAEMQTLYETEKKDKEILVLNKEKEVQRKTNIFLIVLATLILLLGLILWNRYRFKQKTNRLLAEKNSELQKLNATKDKLFAIVAHDLKNPLSAFRSITQNLSDNKLQISKEEIDFFIGRLNQSANQLYDLLQNLLNWAISQIGKLPFVPEKISLADLANDNTRLFENNLLQKKQQVTVNIPETLFVWADKSMIKTVVRNLLSNAVKFTPEGGQIELCAGEENGEAVFTIADSGIGIEPADLNKLFKVEEDVTNVGQSSEKGTGLGLILCKELIEKNKGRIRAESTAGQGSRFIFALPLADN
ncbi:MAG: tetratricopeptide repeat-containing sensor histidine kinase [Chitinophagaceae bacterium]|nr:tetratricopeptide repeat-containing sensor histidine kinase [Chitinophagaceae bacterium]